MNLPTIPVPVCSSFFRPGFFIKGMALAGALVTSAPAFSASVQFFDDPETMQMHYLPDGRVSFAKAGAYLGPMKGERCNQTAMKDMKHDRVELVCKPRTELTVLPPENCTLSNNFNCLNRAPNPLSGGMATWGKGLPHVSGWTASPYPLSASLIGEVMAQAPTSYTLPLVTELVALNFKPAGVLQPPHQPLEGPVAHVQTPAIPLPATAWLMLAGLAMLWRWRT